jgi:hypothetical protein
MNTKSVTFFSAWVGLLLGILLSIFVVGFENNKIK